jgi:hypothetical protein
MSSRIVTLTTDFGQKDPFVGQMKGAALGICGDLRFVDLTHEVPPFDVEAGAFLLETGFSVFPDRSIHVAIVDPGVGTARRGIVARTRRFDFVGPDNGVLSRALRFEQILAVHVLADPGFRRESVSSTFEGRDVFAPAAAWLARGIDPSEFGPDAGGIVTLPGPVEEVAPGTPVRVRVVLIDRFGNVTLDLHRRALEPHLDASGRPDSLRVDTPGGAVVDWAATYRSGSTARACLLINSAGYLEIAWRESSAAERLGLSPGMMIDVAVGGGRARR